jgi:hypothetical protein
MNLFQFTPLFIPINNYAIGEMSCTEFFLGCFIAIVFIEKGFVLLNFLEDNYSNKKQFILDFFIPFRPLIRLGISKWKDLK